MALPALGARHRQEGHRRDWRSQEKMRCWEGKEGITEKSAKLAQSPPEEGEPQGRLALLFPLLYAKGFSWQRRGGSPCGGKDKGLATGSLLCLDGENSYQPIWCLPESLSTVSSTQRSLSLLPEPPLPPAYLLVTGASISRAHFTWYQHREVFFHCQLQRSLGLRGPWRFSSFSLSGKVLSDWDFEAEQWEMFMLLLLILWTRRWCQDSDMLKPLLLSTQSYRE